MSRVRCATGAQGWGGAEESWVGRAFLTAASWACGMLALMPRLPSLTVEDSMRAVTLPGSGDFVVRSQPA